jgi:hypothetical protein
MDQMIEQAAEPVLDLGRWLGRREAFALVAGRCSASEAESLRRIRDQKLYRELDLTWEEFCSKRLGSSRRQIERILRPLDEFGPAYFHVAQITHVTPEEYRAIASYVSAEGIRLDGAVVALLPENSEQVSAAIASFDVVLKRCEALAVAMAGLEGELETTQRYALSAAVCRVRRAALKKGAPGA